MATNRNLNDLDLWQHLVDSQFHGSQEQFTAFLQAFMAPEVNRVPILKQALLNREKLAAVYTLQFLSTDELLPLFDELVDLASWNNGLLKSVRDAIVRLPRQWVLEHIERVVVPILRDGDADNYGRIIELYELLDSDHALALARQALAHDVLEIRDAGETAIDRLNKH